MGCGHLLEVNLVMRVLICLFLFWAQVVFAQQIDKASSAIRLDFANQSKQYQEKSLGLALVQSALLPGLGELYLNRSDRSHWFLGAEILSWAAVVLSYQYGQNQLTRLKSYAITYGRAQGISRNPDLLQQLGEHRFSNRSEGLQPAVDYGQDQAQDELSKGNSLPPLEPYWDWGMAYEHPNSDPYERYRDMLKSYRGSQIALQVSVGMLALNRLLSLLDVFHLYRSGGSQFSLQAIPSTQPTLILAVQF